MKKLRLTLATIFAVAAISTGVFAYTGTDVDTHYNINMPSALSEGKGTVSGISKFQFVDSDASTYATLKKYDAQVNLIKAYLASERDPENTTLAENYRSLCTKYEAKYGTVSALYQEHGNVLDDNTVSDIRSLWIKALPSFDASKWETSTNGQISIDLSTFKGTKYVVAWVQSGDMYDAEIYVVTGTKQDEPEPQPEPNPTPDPEPQPEKPVQEIKKGDTTKADGNMPKTGINDIGIVSLMSVFSIAGVASFIKYRRIK